MAESVVEDARTSTGAQRPKRRTRTSAKRKAATDSKEDEIKRRRTFDNFYTFCSFVLEYEEKLASEDRNGPFPPSSSASAPPSQSPHSPINSAGESSSSSTPSSSDSSSGGSEASDDVGAPDSPNHSSNEDTKLEYTSDDESWNLVTCFCRRPFAGRPMIECSKCETWIHLFCAKIRKDHVPDVYVCPTCTKGSSN